MTTAGLSQTDAKQSTEQILRCAKNTTRNELITKVDVYYIQKNTSSCSQQQHKSAHNEIKKQNKMFCELSTEVT